MNQWIAPTIKNLLGISGKTMADKLTYTPNNDTQITPTVDYYYWLERFYTQLDKPTN